MIYRIRGPVECDQFADDTALISIHDQRATALRNLQESVGRTSLWLQEWRLLVNIAKTQATEISRRTLPYPEPQITLGDMLSTSISRKYLGIMLSVNLNWNDHVTTVIRKATRLIAIMRKLRNSLTKNALTTFYKQYIRPVLEYASTTWCNLTQTQSGRLERCQQRAARLIIGMSLFQHICHSELLSSAKLASLSSRRKLAPALLGHQLDYKNTRLTSSR